jgi:hypothetical protein
MHGLKEQSKALDAVVSRDPAMAQMLQTEALANLLEGLTEVEQQPPAKTETSKAKASEGKKS